MSVRITRKRLSYAAALRELQGPGQGGIVLFSGRVRPDRFSRGRVVALDYEAHQPLAEQALTALERRARSRYGATRVVLWHRVGKVPVDEASVFVGVATGHRAEAFTAARYLIEELKAKAPIWKTEITRPARRRRPRPGGRASR